MRNCGLLDVVFVLDRSGSIYGDWDEVVKFTYDTVNLLNIGPQDTRVGVISFSNNIIVDIPIGANT